MGDYYAEAGKCVEKVLAKKGTPKSVVFELKKSKSTKLIYKLVIEALKFKPVLDELISKCQIEKREKWIGKGRCLCLVYDFLIGSGVKAGYRNQAFAGIYKIFKFEKGTIGDFLS